MPAPEFSLDEQQQIEATFVDVLFPAFPDDVARLRGGGLV